MATTGQLTLATTTSAATRRGTEGGARSLPARPRTGGRSIRVDLVVSIAAGVLATTLLLVALPRMAAVPAPLAPPVPMAAPTPMTAPTVAPAPAAHAAAPAPAPAPAPLRD